MKEARVLVQREFELIRWGREKEKAEKEKKDKFREQW